MEDNKVSDKKLLMAGSNKRCEIICERMWYVLENKVEVLAEKLKLSRVLEKLWIHLTVNFIIKLLLVARKDGILVVCNRLSKITHFIVITKGISVEWLARLFRDNIWKLYGLLESIVLNKRLQFVTNMTKELNNMLEIETKLLTSFHL